MTAWIRIIPEAEASEELEAYYDLGRAPGGTVDNVMKVHGLRPHTLAGHVALYRSVLHDEGNTLPGWLLETIASYTSILNGCAYSLTNHFANARHLMGDEARSDAVLAALQADRPEAVFEGRELAFLRYARKLTLTPGEMCEDDVRALREAGADDGEILEVNQVCCYFNYVNRLLNGLGVSLEGDVVGYYGHGT
jgi:uncharacterized peroxidase-related enzyme